MISCNSHCNPVRFLQLLCLFYRGRKLRQREVWNLSEVSGGSSRSPVPLPSATPAVEQSQTGFPILGGTGLSPWCYPDRGQPRAGSGLCGLSEDENPSLPAQEGAVGMEKGWQVGYDRNYCPSPPPNFRSEGGREVGEELRLEDPSQHHFAFRGGHSLFHFLCSPSSSCW